MSLPIHHVGIAVQDLKTAASFYQQMGYATQSSSPVELVSRGIKVWFLRDLQGNRLELIEKPTLEPSPYHVAYLVEDALEPAIEAQVADQWQVIPELGIMVAFFTGPGGERIELVKANINC